MVERVTISLPRLPQAFEGTTVAVIADLHAGPRRGGIAAIEEIVHTVNTLQPNLIVLLGDMVHRPSKISAYLPLLSRLRAGDGVFACLGNHEHGFVWYSRWFGPWPGPSVDEWRRLYADIGVELLVNEARPFHKRGARIWLIGVDDSYSGRDDLPSALENVGRGDFGLAITHSPDLIDEPRALDLDLILAAHTHGGQVRLPLLGPLYAPCRRARERAAGLLHAGRTAMYVTRGVGESLPVRLACPREIPLIELRRTSAP